MRKVIHSFSACTLFPALTLAAIIASGDDATTQSPSHDVVAIARAYDASAHDLARAFVARPGNVVFSPTSIGAVMAMALSGARGATESEMTRLLHHTLTRAEVDAANRDWMRTIAADANPPSARLQLANANGLLLIDRSRVAPAYAATLRDDYGADVIEGATAEAVNAWVSRKTDGKIDRIVDRLDASVPAVLVNATYFKAPWATPFDPRATRPQPFQVAAATAAPVPMMHASSRYATASGEGYRAIRLPYAGDTLAMIVVVPESAGGVDALVDRLSGNAVAALDATLTATAPEAITLALPRFKTAFTARLAGSFQRLGMRDAFDPTRADLSGMTGRPPRELPMAIGEIFHRALIDVSEEGTEAAAATGLVPRTTALRPLPQPFVVDRPFLFYVVERATGAIFFQGWIADPRSAGQP